ncbi:MAG TPA: MBL fold metallo-hydrolase [Reyranella sp.]|nr:MBL fold metallo-hydrolase [Reyranella sp.]
MKTRLGLLAFSIAALAGCEQGPPPVTEAMVQSHLAAATTTAGSDLKQLLSLCKPAPATRPKGDDHTLEGLINKPAPPAARAFDNLYFLGDSWVSAWAINTRDGIILLDALNSGKEAAKLIEGGLRRVGLNPARIKYIIVTHGHGDHYGGAVYLANKYKGARIVMGEADWAMTSSKLDFETPLWDPPPVFRPGIDISAKDGDTVTLGGTTVTLYATPGHTLGTISPVFDVTWRGQTHRVVEWGGTGFNFGADKTRFEAYIASTARMRDLVKQQNIDVMISNHAGVDLAPEKLAELRKSPRGPNPFVEGEPTVERVMTVMNECAQSQRDRFIMQGVYK